jgi:serine/threonine-protein kinase
MTSKPFGKDSFVPFDVIATGYIATGRSDGKEYDYAGRAHSLWFCDPDHSGQYAWHELGFMGTGAPLPGGYAPPLGGSILSHYFGTVGPGYTNFSPMAFNPDHEEAVCALAKIETTHCYKDQFGLAEPPRIIRIGEMDDFIDKWANWFAEASERRLTRPQFLRQPPRSAENEWETTANITATPSKPDRPRRRWFR